MPKQRIHHSRITPQFPQDFPYRLVRFKEASGLSWAELARCLGTDPFTVRRWRTGDRPNSQHLMALLDLVDQLDLQHSLTTQTFEGTSAMGSSSIKEGRGQHPFNTHGCWAGHKEYVLKSNYQPRDQATK